MSSKELFYIIEQLTLCFQYLVCTSEYIKDWYFPVSELLEDRKHKSNVHNYTDQAGFTILQYGRRATYINLTVDCGKISSVTTEVIFKAITRHKLFLFYF